MSRPLWMVRPGGRQSVGDTLRTRGVVAIGLGRELGAMPDGLDREALCERFRVLHPTWRGGRHRGAAAQLWSFLYDIESGDGVITYDSVEQVYYLGAVVGEAVYAAESLPELPFRRAVDWTHRVDREALPPTTRSALNVLQTLFGVAETHARTVWRVAVDLRAPAVAPTPPPRVTPPPAPAPPAPAPTPRIAAPMVLDEPEPTVPDAPAPAPSPVATIQLVASPSPPPARPTLAAPPAAAPVPVIRLSPRPTAPNEATPDGPSLRVAPTPPSIEDLRARVEEQADQLIEARLLALPMGGVKALVSGILSAMGYPNRRPPSAPAEFEIFAAPNVLGLQEPVLHVRVEHQPERPLSVDALQRLTNALPAEARALIVSTGGFTAAARALASRNTAPHLMLLDLAELRRTLLDHYERIDLETRSLVPLTRIYWPAR